MKKNFVQDVVPPKKSIRNVTLSSRPSTLAKKDIVKPTRSRYEEEDEFTRPVAIKQQAPIRIEPTIQSRPASVQTSEIPSYKYEYDEPKKPSRKWIYASIIVFVLALAFGVSAFFKSAIIKVTPKQETANLNETLRAIKDSVGTALGFQVVTVSKDVEKAVTATGEQKVEKKAQGRIVVYNDTSQIQKLVATTRFETPEGLIYRLPAGISVPAMQVKDGKNIAGSIEVTVEADKVGTSYNIGLKDFTLPGLKGDPKFKTIYARSKTEMTGGFSGMQKVVSKETLDATEVELSLSLKDALAKDIETQIPANFILYKTSLSYKLNPTEQVDSTSGQTMLKKKGMAYAVIFDRSALTKAILAKISPSISSDLVKITNFETLDFSYTTPDTFNPATDTSLNFILKGSPNIVWILDENKLKSDLLGLSREKARTVLSTYDTIKEAWVETHPFWNQTIPSNPDKVTLQNTLTN